MGTAAMMYPAQSIFFERGEEFVSVGITVFSFCQWSKGNDAQ
jgi:hypothetical protein